MTYDRRSFLKQAAGSLATAAVVGCSPGTDRPTRGGPALPAKLLRAVGDTVLPESLGAAGRSAAVAAFNEWIDAYRPVAEEMHGYGDAEITYTPPDPAPGWRAQLEGLDALSTHTRHTPFADLDVAARRDVLRVALRGVRAGRLPSNPLTAPHVAIALLAHWTRSSAAIDLAFGVQVGAETCRVLADSPRRPLPIVTRGTT